MGCCHLDREGLSCVALMGFLFKWMAKSADVMDGTDSMHALNFLN